MSHIANFISAVKVGVKCSKTQIKYAKGPKFLINLIKAIHGEGLVLRYVVSHEKFLTITVFLKTNLIKEIKIVSTPGRKLYTSNYCLRSVIFRDPRTLYFISTSKYGIVSSNFALEKNVGGEVLCYIKV